MPSIQLDTSCSLSDPDKRQSIVQALSRLAAEGIGKPEQYVMACVRDNVAMTLGGTPGPCALVTVKSIGGLSKAANQTLASQVSQMLHRELAIPQNRIYVTLEDVAPTHWAWNGKTFG
ncbi:MAG: tautomerase family protein [Phycisphaerae bacterium]|nr:tautomerase family protein [Phycisphaerae bacterium]